MSTWAPDRGELWEVKDNEREYTSLLYVVAPKNKHGYVMAHWLKDYAQTSVMQAWPASCFIRRIEEA